MPEWEKIYVLSPVTKPEWHGADIKTPEFRFQELKSSLRFWWRAVNYFESAQKMHREEGSLFGSTEIKSPLRFVRLDESELPVENKKNYVKRNNDCENIYFRVKCCCENEEQWDRYQKLFELASYLGGFGGKNDKGSGVYCLNQEEKTLPSDRQTMLNQIKCAMDKVSGREYCIKSNKIVLDEKKKFLPYAMLQSVSVYNPITKAKFESNVKDAQPEAKKSRNNMKDKIMAFSPLMIISAYPAPSTKKGSEMVYPILSRFNVIWQGKYDRTVMNVHYKNYVNACEEPFKIYRSTGIKDCQND